MNYAVEKCTSSDLNDIFRLESEYIECSWTKKNILDALNSDGYSFYKAIDGQNFLGYGGVQWCAPEGNICNVAVDASARRRGVGTAILNAIENECMEKGALELYLEVNERNEGAIALYQKNGYSITGKRPRYYGSDSAILMKKEIK